MMRRHGLTLTELVFVLALSLVLFAAVFSLAGNLGLSARLGADKLGRMQELRLVVEALKRDIRAGGWSFQCPDDHRTLALAAFQTTTDGLPDSDTLGLFRTETPLEYRFQAPVAGTPTGRLLRADRVVATTFSDVRFVIRKQLLGAATVPVIAVEIDQPAVDGVIRTYAFQVVPRHVASWARQPFWASITNGQPWRYQF